MATRFYLPASGASPVTTTPSSSWDTTTGFDSIFTNVGKSGTTLANGTARAKVSQAGAQNRLDRQYISAPIAAQTISVGTFSAVIRGQLSTTAGDAWLQIIIRVVSNNGSTQRGVIYAGSTASSAGASTTDGPENQEFDTVMETRIKNALTTTSVTAQSGDRVVIEVGFRAVTANTNTVTFNYGDVGATADLATTAGATTAGIPWVELSQTLTFLYTQVDLAFSPSGTNAAAVTAGNSGFDLVNIGTGNTLTYDTSVATHSSASMSAVVGSTVDSDYGAWTTQWGEQQDHVYARLYMRLAGYPAAAWRLANLAVNGTVTVVGLTISTTGAVRTIYGPSNSNGSISTNVIPLNTWVRIEVDAVLGASGSVDVRLYLTDPESSTPTETTSSSAINTGLVCTDIRSPAQGMSHSVFVGPFAVSNTTQPGPLSTTYSGATTLAASASLSTAGIRTTSGAVTLAATPTLTTAGIRSTDGAVSLASGTTLTTNGITTKIGAAALSASASLTSAITTLTTTGAVSLTSSATLTSDGVRTTSGAATLTTAQSLTLAGLLTAGAAVSLVSSPTLTSLGVRTTSGASDLTAVPTLTVSGAVTQSGAVSMAATASLVSIATLEAFGAVALSQTPSFVVGAQLTAGGAVSLLATGVLTGLTGGLNAFSVVSLSALPSLVVSSIRITSASVNLSATPALLVSASQVMFGSVSLISTSSFSINPGAVGATVNLSVIDTLTVGATLQAFGTVSLSSTSTLSVAGRLDTFGSVTVTAIPVLTVAVSVRITNGSAVLSALGVLTTNGIRIADATVVPLVASGNLSVDGFIGSGGASNLIATPILLIAGVTTRFSATQLTALSTLTVNAALIEFGAVSLLVNASLSSAGVVFKVGSALLTTSQTLQIFVVLSASASVNLQAVPSLTFIDLFPEIDVSVSGSWYQEGIHTTDWSTDGIHVGSVLQGS